MVPTYCLNGHFVGWESDPLNMEWGDVLRKNHERDFERDGTLLPSFCVRCGSRNIDACEACCMSLYVAPDCEKTFVLRWLRQTPTLDGERFSLGWGVYGRGSFQFSSEEKAQLKENFKNLTMDTAAMPVAANRFRRAVEKAGPALGKILLEIVKTVATDEAKKHLGL